jgi:3-hydroxybutyryl-CoA dehydrogenase
MPELGILAKADFTGLSLFRDALANRTYIPPEPSRRSDTLDRLLADGRSGVTAGKGFFDWSGNPEDLFRQRDLRLLALKKAFREIGPLQGK